MPQFLINILIFLAVWNFIPHIILWTLKGVPSSHKRKASKRFLESAIRGTIMLLPNLLAPIVVPFALLFTKWEDEHMPKLFTIWDNDLGMNGDPRRPDGGNFVPVPLEDFPELRAGCYWAEGKHPRSFKARFIWMGLRNRASKGAVMVGAKFKDVTPQRWGDELTENGHPGWCLTERGGNYQLYIIRKFGPFAYRFNYGFKVFQDREGKIMPINITASLKRWKPKN